MRVLIASEDTSLGGYLEAQGYKVKTVFVNDVVLQAAGMFSADAVIYFTNVIAVGPHEDVIRALCTEGVRVLLAAEKGDPLRAYAAALGVTDFLDLPLDPADVLYRLENPASREEAAEAARLAAAAGGSGAAPALSGRAAEAAPAKQKYGSAAVEEARDRRPARDESLPAGAEPEGLVWEAGGLLEDAGAEAVQQSAESALSAGRAAVSGLLSRAAGVLPGALGALRSLKKKRAAGTGGASGEEQPPLPLGGTGQKQEVRLSGSSEGVPGLEWDGEDETQAAVVVPPDREPGTALEAAAPEVSLPGTGGPAAAAAAVDPLTGCFTRAAAVRAVPDGPYAVVFIDLDGFKPVNDTLGHEAGDRVLAAFGRMLKEELKGRDVPVRWGGDEFVLLLPGTGLAGARALADSLAARWRSYIPDTGGLEVGFSWGAAAGTGPEDFEEAVRAADAAMYSTKERKKRAAVRVPALSAAAVPGTAGQAGRSEEEYTVLDGVKDGMLAALTLLEVAVVVSCTVWMAHQAAALMGKDFPFLERANELVVWFWSAMWHGLAGK